MRVSRFVPRAVRQGALMALLVLTAVFAMVLGAGGGFGAVSAPEGRPVSAAESGNGAGAEGQPSDAADSEARPGAGESARGRSRKGHAAGPVVPYRSTRTPNPSPPERPLPHPATALGSSTVRCVVLRC
ncbi:hypothetical protein [Streptomyces spiramyceticus]|uniref:hypothetical protein n=1 Tax=Streptomyces spiramyceticus TaxID=299717 RepID=UPI00237B219C|nr:hypothetical protein [Streptomyces spiramyceticus]